MIDRTMFGTTEGDDAGCGLIDFLDGCIADASHGLLIDMMKPHHGSYYMTPDDGHKPVPEPTDFDSPVPVPFLSVKGTFLIAIAKRDKRLPDNCLEQASLLVTQSLAEWGIGGKTNADYGRLKLESEVPRASRMTFDSAATDSVTATNVPPVLEVVSLVPRVGDTVEVELTTISGSGKWKAKLVVGSGQGTILNSEKIPRDKAKNGKRISVKVTQAAVVNNLQFEYVKA